MSMYKDENGVLLTQIPKEYNDGRTKQSFMDETDINKILSRAQKTGTISHLAKYEAKYGDFANFDFQEAQFKLAEANTIFAELPSEIRKEFKNSPQEFFEYANDPARADKLRELLPALAQPGRQHIDLRAEPADPPAPKAQPAQPETPAEPQAAPPVPPT